MISNAGIYVLDIDKWFLTHSRLSRSIVRTQVRYGVRDCTLLGLCLDLEISRGTKRYFPMFSFFPLHTRRDPGWMWLPLDRCSIQSGACLQRSGVDVRLLVCRTCCCAWNDSVLGQVLLQNAWTSVPEEIHERLLMGLHADSACTGLITMDSS